MRMSNGPLSPATIWRIELPDAASFAETFIGPPLNLTAEPRSPNQRSSSRPEPSKLKRTPVRRPSSCMLPLALPPSISLVKLPMSSLPSSYAIFALRFFSSTPLRRMREPNVASIVPFLPSRPVMAHQASGVSWNISGGLGGGTMSPPASR
jgi:hypothetical protein